MKSTGLVMSTSRFDWNSILRDGVGFFPSWNNGEVFWNRWFDAVKFMWWLQTFGRGIRFLAYCMCWLCLSWRNVARCIWHVGAAPLSSTRFPRLKILSWPTHRPLQREKIEMIYNRLVYCSSMSINMVFFLCFRRPRLKMLKGSGSPSWFFCVIAFPWEAHWR